MEKNFASLLCDDQVLKITEADGRVREIKFKKLSALRTMDVVEKYNKIIIPTVVKARKEKDGTDEEKVTTILIGDIKKTKKMLLDLVKLCLEIIRPVGIVAQFKSMTSGNWVSKKWILTNLDSDQMKDFIAMITKPIIGEKKTVMENQ